MNQQRLSHCCKFNFQADNTFHEQSIKIHPVWKHSSGIHSVCINLLQIYYIQHFKSFSFSLCFKVMGLNPAPTLKVFSMWVFVWYTVTWMISSYEVATTVQYCALVWWSIIGFMRTQTVYCRAKWCWKNHYVSDHFSLLVSGWDGCRPWCGLVYPLNVLLLLPWNRWQHWWGVPEIQLRSGWKWCDSVVCAL